MLLIGAAAGCAQLPAPALPVLPRDRAAIAFSHATTFSWSKARVTAPGAAPRDVETSWGGDNQFGGGRGAARAAMLLVPALVAAQGRVSDRFDLGAHFGWQGAGLSGRYRFDEPWAISVDGQIDPSRMTYQARLLLDASGLAPGRAVLNLGVSAGRWPHFVFLPRDLADVPPESIGHAGFKLRRSEVRIEGAVGQALTPRVLFVVQPALVVAAGAVRDASCSGCLPDLALAHFRHPFTVVASLVLLRLFE